ncbi:MBL fold metallo-hydrolase [Jatrophihabitans sp.]|uniref:MBL fold metallo-hydrolase n=1 Tax=Jatrophihabitans sp. TaxID=1932789 RepID=UPI002BE17BA5|nr:MBL fold metallo-hydrolase [Jatrophihabitans sp.]
MPAWICTTCGVQQADTDEPPPSCAICTDERQYVGWEGQRWTTMAEIGAERASELREEEPGLLGIGTRPAFAIGQRALLVSTEQGNVLWDCVSLLDEAAHAEVSRRGGISAICLSHPHFYAACVEWADAFDAEILIPEADRQWIQRPSGRVRLWQDRVEPVPGLTVARIGGHFDGAAVLHWPVGAEGRGALLTGDTVTVVQDREWVSFMWSYPNLIPLDPATIGQIVERISPFAFDRVYGGWWGRVVVRDGAAAIRRSAQRYLDRLAGERP